MTWDVQGCEVFPSGLLTGRTLAGWMCVPSLEACIWALLSIKLAGGPEGGYSTSGSAQIVECEPGQ